jgi:hypothetical protein
VDWRLTVAGVRSVFLSAVHAGSNGDTVGRTAEIVLGKRARETLESSTPNPKLVERADGRGKSATASSTIFESQKKPLRISLPLLSRIR